MKKQFVITVSKSGMWVFDILTVCQQFKWIIIKLQAPIDHDQVRKSHHISNIGHRSTMMPYQYIAYNHKYSHGR